MSKRIILIVEDEREIREILQQVLELEGYQTTTAANGLEAMRAIEEDQLCPNVILLDLMMPVMNGWEFLARQEERKDSTPVVVVSAAAELGRKIKANAFLRKPVELDLLLETIERYAS